MESTCEVLGEGFESMVVGEVQSSTYEHQKLRLMLCVARIGQT